VSRPKLSILAIMFREEKFQNPYAGTKPKLPCLVLLQGRGVMAGNEYGSREVGCSTTGTPNL